MLDADKLWSIAAEAGVLGSMIVGPECCGEVITILPDEAAFFKAEHQRIYIALQRLFLAGVAIDAVMLRDELGDDLECIGGVQYIASLMDSVPSAANAVYYAKIVKEKQRYRQLINAIENIKKVPDGTANIDEQVQKLQDIALGLTIESPERKDVAICEVATQVATDMQDNCHLIPTGFRNIDRIIHGVAPGELILVAGRPSMGKSGLVLEFALRMAKAGKSVVFFTLEMSYQSLIERALCNLADVDMEVIKSGNAPQPELDKLYQTALGLKNLDLRIYEGVATPEAQLAYIKTRKKIGKVDAVFVDYLQVMSSGNKAESRYQEITAISRKLKLAAMQEHVPIIAASQLNRAVEGRTSHRPRMSDLRESGSLEQDADIVMLLHREDYYRRSEDPEAKCDGAAELIIAKNRRGPTGIAKLIFLDNRVAFGDLNETAGVQSK
ncbi:MAG TPA: replicative DNA helicase [Sedimentisphaerales bacterium]|nr:replicative DNA helicase [Sedimentisphaerales bacterium]